MQDRVARAHYEIAVLRQQLQGLPVGGELALDTQQRIDAWQQLLEEENKRLDSAERRRDL